MGGARLNRDTEKAAQRHREKLLDAELQRFARSDLGVRFGKINLVFDLKNEPVNSGPAFYP